MLSKRPCRRTIIVLLWALAGTSTTAHAADPVVAVFRLQDQGARIAAPIVDRMSDYVAIELVRLGGYKVVPDDALKTVLAKQKAESYKACYDDACQIEVGKELAANKVVSGTILKIGRQCIVTLTLYDLRDSAKEAAGKGRGRCSEDGVLASVDRALIPLVRRDGGAELGGAAVTAAAQQARARAADTDWKRIQKWLRDDRLPTTRRVGILEKHLFVFSQDHPHEAAARAQLGRLQTQASMVLIPGGPFFFGLDAGVKCPRWRVRSPGRRTSVATFYIDRTEVTVGAFRQCVESGACDSSTFDAFNEEVVKGKGYAPHGKCNYGAPGRDQDPMNCVTRGGAEAFCRSLGKRLPSQQEWEKAARGTDGRPFPWGRARVSCKYAVVKAKRWAPNACGRNSTWPVGSKPAGASPYGVLDMVGNVQEWTAGRTGRASGGSYSNSAGSDSILAMQLWGFKASYNYQPNAASKRDGYTGFRCAMPARLD